MFESSQKPFTASPESEKPVMSVEGIPLTKCAISTGKTEDSQGTPTPQVRRPILHHIQQALTVTALYRAKLSRYFSLGQGTSSEEKEANGWIDTSYGH